MVDRIIIEKYLYYKNNIKYDNMKKIIVVLIIMLFIVSSMPSIIVAKNKNDINITQNKNDIDRNIGNVTYPDDLSNPHNKADYLIITSDFFYYPARDDFNQGTLNNKLNELAHWRAEYNNFDVAIINVNDSFVGGNTDTNIKSFIEYVYNYWNAPHMSDNHVEYILLVGDTHYVTSHSLLDGVADRWYACVEDEDYIHSDFLIGRFPANNNTQLDIIIEKTIQYEQNPAAGEWQKNILMTEGSIPYIDGLNQIYETLLENGGWNVSKIYSGPTQSYIDNINEGTKIMIYFGHGSSSGISYFWNCHINQLNNSNKLPFFLSQACNTGTFQDENLCFGEELLFAPNKGIIAFYGSSKETYSTDENIKLLFKAIFSEYNYILGDIINYISQFSNFSIDSSYFAYNLLGDPALDLSSSVNNKADLAIRGFLLKNDNIYALQTGTNNINISATIDNIGDISAFDVHVNFDIIDFDGNCYNIGNQIIPEIHPNESIICNINWYTTEIPKHFKIIVKIDKDNNIEEAYENNNQAGRLIKTIAGKELLIYPQYLHEVGNISYINAYKNIVVWDDTHILFGGIYGYNSNISTVFPISINKEIGTTSTMFTPDVFNNIVVFENNSDIYAYNLSSSIEFPICTNSANQSNPAIYENIVVWTDNRNNNDDIYAYNLSSSIEFPICTNSANQSNPAIYENIVVWTDNRNGNSDIYKYDLILSTEFPICIASADQRNPVIYKNMIIWDDNRNGNSDIYAYNLSSSIEFPICTIFGEQTNPAIYENIVVWTDNRNNNDDIYAYNLSSSIEFPICTIFGEQTNPAIYENTIFWIDKRDPYMFDDSIYGCKLIFEQSTESSMLTAYINSPNVIYLDESVQFSGTAIGGKPPYTYEWDFDDDGIIDITGQNIWWTFDSIGYHTINMKVTDSEGNTTYYNTQICVIFRSLEANIIGPYNGFVNEPIYIHVDVIGGIPPYPIFVWIGTVSNNQQDAMCIYNEPGTYEIRVIVMDSVNNFDDDYSTVHVQIKGDVDGDNDIDNDDLDIIIQLQGMTSGNPESEYNPFADLDSNGYINSYDRLLLLQILNQ